MGLGYIMIIVVPGAAKSRLKSTQNHRVFVVFIEKVWNVNAVVWFIKPISMQSSNLVKLSHHQNSSTKI